MCTVYSVQDSKRIKLQNVDLVLIISMEHRSLNIARDSLFDILSVICFEKKNVFRPQTECLKVFYTSTHCTLHANFL